MKGKLLIGQAGGATAVINRSLAGAVLEARASGAFDAIWGMRRALEGALAGDLADLSDLAPEELQALAETPGAALGSSRHKATDEDLDRLLEHCVRHDVRTFLYIGGNDSADTVHRLARQAEARHVELRAIAIPKTIDNDLPETDHSPGYGSIARFVATAASDSAQDTESMPTVYPVKIIEVMGRDAGWVAAAAGLARRQEQDAPHLIYVPERPLSPQRLLAEVEGAYRRFGRVVAVTAETVRDERGEPLADPSLSQERDGFGHPLLWGAADTMCRLIHRELGLRARFDKPGSLQRMSMLTASSVDLAEAEAVGRAAVRLALVNETDRMVTLLRHEDAPYATTTGSAPLERIANRQWLLPSCFLSPDGTAVTQAFRAYARPLLGPEPLPRYTRLSAPSVHW